MIDPLTFQPRLFLQALDQEATKDPTRLFCIHAAFLERADHEWRRLTVGDFARAVDNFAWWMEKSIAPQNVPERLVYIGPNDIRYALFVVGCMKLGHCPMLLAPSTSQSVTESLLKSGNCSKLLFASDYQEKVRQIENSKQSLQAWEVKDLWEYFGTPSSSFPCSQEYTLAKERETAVVLYSSGTTGIPKEIPLPYGYFTALDYFQHIPIPDGRSTTAPWLSEPNEPFFLRTTLFHATGIITWAAAILHRTHFVIGPSVPLTGTLLKDIVCETGAHTALFLPDTLSSLSLSADGLEALASLRCVSFVGMSLPTSVGNKISQVALLQSTIGLTESGYFSTFRPEDRSDWEYFEWNPNHPVEMRNHDNECSQLVIPRPTGRYTHSVFMAFPDQDEFHTGDLFMEHPRRKGLWKHIGRQGDVSKLQNRVLLHPVPIEAVIEEHHMVSKALITTDHALRAVLVVDPDWKRKCSVCSKEDLVDQIWPVVEKINGNLPVEANIGKNRILVASVDKPFKTTLKGGIRRRLILEDYLEDIEALSHS